MVQPLQRRVWVLLKNLKLELPYYLAIPLPSIFPEKNRIQKDTCPPVLTAPKLTIAKV